MPILVLLLFVTIAYQYDSPFTGSSRARPVGADASKTALYLLLCAALFGVTLGSRRVFKYGAALRQPDAIDLIADDPRAPILFLRSFDDDAAPDYTGSVIPLGPHQTVEMRLAEAFRSVGPVVSIGRPGERLPELGTNRFYVSNDDWQQAVLYFLERAAAVIVLVGRSTGVTWEITTALRNVPLVRLLFVFLYILPRERRTLATEMREWIIESTRRGDDRLSKKLFAGLRDEREARYTAFRNQFACFLQTELPSSLATDVFLDFTQAGSARLLPTRQPPFVRRERDRQGVTLDYRRTLRPFFEKLQGRAIQSDWVERFFANPFGVVVFTVFCSAVAVAGFFSPFLLGFNSIGLALFFLTLIPGQLAYWGVWNLAQASASKGHAPTHPPTPADQGGIGAGAKPAEVAPAPSLVRVTHAVYGLQALSLLIIPAVLAVIINYVERKRAQGTYLDSHFRWQIRTFWFALLWFMIAVVLAVTIVLAPFALAIIVGLGGWMIYRILHGWRALNRHEPT